MLIFLDIDGVMVPQKSWKSPALLNDGFPAFSQQATQALQKLISEGAIVMLTTSHKSNYSIDEWHKIFSERGIDVKKINTLGPNIANLTRREEILNWFNLYGQNEEFIIIDDDKSLNSLPAFFKANLILTNPMVGLTHQNVEDWIIAKGIQLQTA